MTSFDPGALGPIRSILAQLTRLAPQDRVSVATILDEFGDASFASALMVPALIVVSPLSGIFFLPTVMGMIIALIAVQMLVGRRVLWLPGFLLRRSIDGARLGRAAALLNRPAAWMDRQTRVRLRLFQVWPLAMVAPLGCVVAGLMMPFLELVPLSSSILGGAVTLFAVAILARDGLFVVLGLISVGVASLIPLFMFTRFI